MTRTPFCSQVPFLVSFRPKVAVAKNPGSTSKDQSHVRQYSGMIRAVIFDLDGTLVDTEPLHFSAFNEVLRDDGIEIGFDDYTSRLIGLNDRDCFATVLRENRKDAGERHVADLIARKTAVYQAMIAERDVLYPGAERFVRDCAHRFPLLIATGCLRAQSEAILRHSGLRDLFLDIIA